jgi:titin
VTGYTVTASPDGATATGSSSPIVVSGLANGTAYTFTVHATNAVGDGPESAPSAPVTPGAATPPAAPTGLTVSAGDGRVGLSWVAPTVNGGAPVTDYVVQYRPSGTTTWTSIDEASTATLATVTGLTNNTAYDFAVQAVNSAGPGVASAVQTVTPSAQLLPDPGFESGNGGWIAFKIGTLSRVTSPVHGGTTALQVASPSTGASLVGLTQNSVVPNTVAGYVYTASCYVQPTVTGLNVQLRFLEYTQSYGSSATVGNTPVITLSAGGWTQVSISGTALRTGERMIPQIYSTNETSTNGSILYDDCSVVGGAPAAAATVPAAPSGVSAVAGDGSATVSFSAPAANGSPITSYAVSASPGGATVTGSSSPLLVSGLTDGVSYTFTVTATNGVGTGAASSPSNSVTPVAPMAPTVPSAPTAVSAVAGNGSATVSFGAPASNGSPITSYTVSASPGVATGSGSASPITVGGLTNGTSYTFTVTAANGVGTGPASSPSNAVTPAAPSNELLPDPGFESGNSGWVAFKIGTLSRVNSPVHGGTSALKVTSPSTRASLVGLTQNSVVTNTVAGTVYTASCYVRPTVAKLNVQLRFLEYTQSYSSSITVATVSMSSLPSGSWTLVRVVGTAVNASERMIPQIYSTNQTSTNGSMLYDDCSVTHN